MPWISSANSVELVGELGDRGVDEGVELFAGVPLREIAGGADRVLDFAGEQLPVLFAAIVGFAFDVQENPACLVAAHGIEGRFAHLRSDRTAGVTVRPSWRNARCRRLVLTPQRFPHCRKSAALCTAPPGSRGAAA
jgi:hypothetical protein